MAMPTRRFIRLIGLLPGQGWRQTLIAVLLWGGVTVFIFGIIIDKIR
jgi:hypothetical protein